MSIQVLASEESTVHQPSIWCMMYAGLQQASHCPATDHLCRKDSNIDKVREEVYMWMYLKTAPESAVHVEQPSSTWTPALPYSAKQNTICHNQRCNHPQQIRDDSPLRLLLQIYLQTHNETAIRQERLKKSVSSEQLCLHQVQSCLIYGLSTAMHLDLSCQG